MRSVQWHLLSVLSYRGQPQLYFLVMLVPIFPAHSLLFCYLLGPWVGFPTLLSIYTSAHPLFPQSAPAILTHLIYLPMLLGAILMVYLYHLLGSLQVLNTISLESDPISCHNLFLSKFLFHPLDPESSPIYSPNSYQYLPVSACIHFEV